MTSNKCSICYLSENECEGTIKTKCNHFSCLPCFVKWNKANEIATCPECRTPYIDKKNIVSNINESIDSDDSDDSDSFDHETYIYSVPNSIKIYIGPEFSYDFKSGLNKLIETTLMFKFKENGLMKMDDNNNIIFVLDEFASTIFNKSNGYEIKYENFSSFIKSLI
jgi:hypothetical protein